MIRRSRVFCCRRIVIMLFAFYLHTVVYASEAPVSPYLLPVGTIILDAGHGGSDPGAIGSFHMELFPEGTSETTSADDEHASSEPVIVYEKDINLNLTKKIAKQLRDRLTDVTIVETRNEDVYVSLYARVFQAQELLDSQDKGKLFVSIHANSVETEFASGYEIWRSPRDRSIDFIRSITNEALLQNFTTQANSYLNETFDAAVDNAVGSILLSMEEKIQNSSRNRGVKEGDLYVLSRSYIPSLLIEVGFLSNPEECALLVSESYQNLLASAISDGIVSYLSLIE